MKCPACGTVNAPTYALCTACNTPLRERADLPKAVSAAPPPPAPTKVVSAHWQVAGGAYANIPSRGDVSGEIMVVPVRGKLVGLHVRTGEMLWWNQLTHQDHGITDLVIDRELVFATTSTQMLFCIEYLTGRTRWTAPTTSPSAILLVDGPRIFVSHGDDVHCYNIQGYRLWRQKLPGMAMSRTGLGLPGHVRLGKHAAALPEGVAPPPPEEDPR